MLKLIEPVKDPADIELSTSREENSGLDPERAIFFQFGIILQFTVGYLTLGPLPPIFLRRPINVIYK